MPTLTVFAGTDDARVFAQEAAYATANAAGTKTVQSTASNAAFAGQVWSSGSSVYQIFQAGFPFDTSSLAGAEVTAATLSIYGGTDNSVTDFTIEVFAHDWGAAIDQTDWRTSTQLSAMTAVATYATSGGWSNTGYNAFTSVGLAAAINTAGTTKLWAASSRQRTATVPTGFENVACWYADDGGAGTTRDPKLVITYNATSSGTSSNTTSGSGALTVDPALAGTSQTTTAGSGPLSLDNLTLGGTSQNTTAGSGPLSVGTAVRTRPASTADPQTITAVRFDVLDQWGNHLGELHPAPGATIQFTVADKVQRKLSGITLPDASVTLPDGTTRPVDLYGDRVQPVWIDATGETPLGLFMWVNRTLQPDGSLTGGNLHDPGHMLDTELGAAYSLPDVTLITTALDDLHTAVGMTPNITPMTAVTNGPLAWPPTASRIDVIRELCGLAGAVHHIDRNGTPQIRPIPDPQLDPPDVTYDEGSDSTLINDTLSETDDLLDKPTGYRVISTSPTDMPIVGEFELPPSSPASAENRGYKRWRTVEEPGIESNAAAAARALELARQDASVVRTVEFSAAVNPAHDGHMVVAYLGEPFLEESWSIDVSAKRQQHKAKSVITL